MIFFIQACGLFEWATASRKALTLVSIVVLCLGEKSRVIRVINILVASSSNELIRTSKFFTLSLSRIYKLASHRFRNPSRNVAIGYNRNALAMNLLHKIFVTVRIKKWLLLSTLSSVCNTKSKTWIVLKAFQVILRTVFFIAIITMCKQLP